MIELAYGSGMFEFFQDSQLSVDKRKNYLSNAMNVARMSKGIGLMLTADVNRKIFMRAPLDCA